MTVAGTVVEDRPLHVVGVLPFVNRTGDAGLDWVGGGLAQLVTDGLAGSRLLQVVAADRMTAVDAEGLAAAAADLGLTAVVSGEMLPGPEGFYGVGEGGRSIPPGKSLAARRVDGLGEEDLLRCADDLVAEARRGLGLPPTEQVDVHTADFVADNPEAYEAYLRGLGFFVDFRYDDAEGAFREALAWRLPTPWLATVWPRSTPPPVAPTKH